MSTARLFVIFAVCVATSPLYRQHPNLEPRCRRMKMEHEGPRNRLSERISENRMSCKQSRTRIKTRLQCDLRDMLVVVKALIDDHAADFPKT